MENLQRIIQESVDGKEVVLAHVIASPAPDIYDRIGVTHGESIGILTLSPERPQSLQRTSLQRRHR